MTQTPGEPLGYDKTWNCGVPDMSDFHITGGINQTKGEVDAFLIRLHYRMSAHPLRWTSIARFDHNEHSTIGHDVYEQGLHIDVSIGGQNEIKLYPSHGSLPSNTGIVIEGCISYFETYAGTFVDIYNGTSAPENPPKWPDGGKFPNNFYDYRFLYHDVMESQPSDENTLTREETAELLAEITGTTPEEIKQGAAELEIEPPEEATVVEVR